MHLDPHRDRGSTARTPWRRATVLGRFLRLTGGDMANDKCVTKRRGLACVTLAGVLAIALIAAGSVSQAQAARVLPLPSVIAETYEIDFQGRPAVVLHNLLLRRIQGTPTVTCNRCLRFAAHKLLRSSPSRTSRRYRHADWILRGGRAVKITVTRRGWIGRYLLLTAHRRKGGLGYKASGCLNGRGKQIRCPRGPKPPPTLQTVPVSPPPTVAPTTTLPAPDQTAAPAVPTESVIYAVNQAGELMWYRHRGHQDGSLDWATPTRVATGWGSFKDVFAGDNGVIYAIQPNGELMWYRHLGREDGTWSWLPPKKVGTSWAAFTKVFSGGTGVIYAIQPNGDLRWYRHLGREDGSPSWSGPKNVGSGWTGFTEVFSGGSVAVYGIQPNGDLIWYRHLGREDGSWNWSGPKNVGSGWTGFKRIVPAPA
jgi:hypothetical protein